MQAILVKYVTSQSSGGSSYTAKSQAGSVRMARDYALNDADNALAAAFLLCQKLGWTGSLHGGGLPNGDFVFVFDGPAHRIPLNDPRLTATKGRSRKNTTGRRTPKRPTKKRARRRSNKCCGF